MSENDETLGKERVGKLNRRQFIAAVGATAASAALFRETLKADVSSQYFYDSFGNVVIADGPAVSLGIPVPPLPEGVYPPGPPLGPDAIRLGSLGLSSPGRRRDHLDDDAPPAGNTTHVTPSYNQNNLLMIMIDQLRYPVWVPAGSNNAITAFDSILPNIANLRNHSFVFANYTVAATNCTPSRAALLTGLYAQQTCMFKTQTSNSTPSLVPTSGLSGNLTGFPTIGNILTQNFGASNSYSAYWIGKWHLSDFLPNAGGVGGNGPIDYGFTDWGISGTPSNLPSGPLEASPNGLMNEGTRGSNPAGQVSPPQSPTNVVALPITYMGETVLEYDDAYIADRFINTFLQNVGTYNNNPYWFAAVSFVNPHDMSFFPNSSGLSNTSGDFGYPSGANNGHNASYYMTGYKPPLTAGYSNAGSANYYIPPYSSAALYGAGNSNWNVYDFPTQGSYDGGNGKPEAQFTYLVSMNNTDGPVLGYNSSNPADSDVTGWLTFLN